MTYKEIIEALENTYISDEYITDGNYYHMIIEPLREEGYKFSYTNGCTKLVILFENTNYAVKISFDAESYYDYEFEETRYSQFEGTRYHSDEDIITDYCMLDYYVYQSAVKYGVEKFFAETKKIGCIFGHNIWAQPLCVSYEDCGDCASASITEEQISSGKRIVESDNYSYSGVDDIDYYWVAELLNWCSEEEINKLMDFIKYEDIRDLHSGNYGYCEGRGIIFDYSGYYE